MNRFLPSFVIGSLLAALFTTNLAVGQSKDNKEVAPKKEDLAKKELDALQGTWDFVFYEEKGVKQKLTSSQFVFSDKTLTFRVGGVDKIETTIEIDPAKKKKELTQKFKDGQVYQSIYVLADNYLLLCGHRDKTKKPPTEFACGENSGGEFLILLKRQP